MNTLVSVIIPTCHRPDNLSRAIKSVINQTYSNYEIIVIDDNGLNTNAQIETEQLISEFNKYNNFQYFPLESNMGAAYARNKGIELSKGNFVAFLDDDDEFLPEKLSYQVERLLNFNGYGACYCRQQFIHKDKAYLVDDNYIEGDLSEDILLLRNHVNTSCLLFRKNILTELNGFNTRLVRHEDWDLLLRFFQNNKIAVDNSLKPQVNRYVGSFSHAPKGLDIIKRHIYYLKEFKSYIEKKSNSSLIFKEQWKFVYSELFRQNYVFLGLMTAFKANSHKLLSYNEWHWVIARFCKNCFKRYKG